MSAKFLAWTTAALLAGTMAFSFDASAAMRAGGGGGHGGGGFHGGGFRGRSFGGFHFGGAHFGGFGGHRYGFGGARHFGGTNRFAAHDNLAHGAALGALAGTGRGASGVGKERGFEHGHFGDRGFRRDYVGWGGSVFWPYAYDDLFDYSWWPYYDGAYGDAFWAYGYDDIFAGVLTPEYFATTTQTVAAAPGGAATAAATAPQAEDGPVAICGAGDATGSTQVDRIASAIHLSDDQRGKLDALRNAQTDARKALAAACPTQTPGNAPARLDDVQARLQAMAKAIDTVRGPLDDFYASLNDEQKAQFNALGQAPRQGAPEMMQPARLCGPQSGIPVISVSEIDAAVQPNEQQKADLTTLSNAAETADKDIVATCPAQPPLTPPGRLDAVKARLDAMLKGIDAVRAPLQTFYASLSPQQQAHFDVLNEKLTAGGQPSAKPNM